MVHKIEEGKAMIEAEKSTGKVLQIGSQRVSSILTEKAADIYDSLLNPERDLDSRSPLRSRDEANLPALID